MINKEALEYLVGLAKVEIIEVDGQPYSTKPIYHVKEPSPAAICISTLTGLVDYVKSGVDGMDLPQIIHIASPTEVKLYSEIKPDMARDNFITCTAQTPKIIMNQFVDMETFNIMLQSCFDGNEDSENILKIIGNIKEENVNNFGDDGVSQSVVAKVGIATVADIKLPNPVILAPFRTFAEVEQPASKFVFRMQTGPKAALFEADGGAWKQTAMVLIKDYLEKALTGCDVKIIA